MKSEMGSYFPWSQYLASPSRLTRVLERSLIKFRTASFKEKGAKRKERAYKIIDDNFERCLIWRTINNMRILKNAMLSVNMLLKQIRSPESVGFKGGSETLRRILKEMGFIWSKSTVNRKFLMERSDTVVQRINFFIR